MNIPNQSWSNKKQRKKNEKGKWCFDKMRTFKMLYLFNEKPEAEKKIREYGKHTKIFFQEIILKIVRQILSYCVNGPNSRPL